MLCFKLTGNGHIEKENVYGALYAYSYAGYTVYITSFFYWFYTFIFSYFLLNIESSIVWYYCKKTSLHIDSNSVNHVYKIKVSLS